MYYRDRRTAVGLTDFAPPWPLVSVTATLAAFRVLDKWNEPDKREKDGATINFFEYLEVVHGAQVPSRGSRAPVVSRSSASGGGILRCPSKDKGSGMPQPKRRSKGMHAKDSKLGAAGTVFRIFIARNVDIELHRHFLVSPPPPLQNE